MNPAIEPLFGFNYPQCVSLREAFQYSVLEYPIYMMPTPFSLI